PALGTYRVYQFRLAKPAATMDVQVAGDVAQLVHRSRLQRGVGVAGALRAALRRATLLPPVAVHRATCNLLRAILGCPALAVPFLDMLELALVLPAPCRWHAFLPPFSGRMAQGAARVPASQSGAS